MEDISIDARMHVKDPSVIQLYSCSTPNGIKVAACLEELVELRSHKEDFTYEAHTVDLRKGETRGGPYALIAPHGKIPALVDPCVDGPDPITVFESGAILVYLAEKYAELLPCGNSALRAECLSWTFWGSTSVSTQFKAFGFYHKYCVHQLDYCEKRYATEVERLLGVLDRQLGKHGGHWICGDLFTIADLAVWPWVHALSENYDDAATAVFRDFKSWPHVKEWTARCLERPASKRAMDVCTMFA